MNHKIFIVEDDPIISQGLKTHLSQWGYECFSVDNFERVLDEMSDCQPDMVLMDISLPYYNGFYWCEQIRQISEIPIIFLSSASDNMNMVMAMNMGADDFISKPFDFSVLVAKIQALLRRSYQFGIVTSYQNGAYQLLFQDNRVKYKDEVVDISPTECKILSLLFQYKNQVVTKEMIMEKLWEGDDFIGSNTLSVNMTRLRKKLSVIQLDDHIQTVKGKGYLLDGLDR
ncbi:MULTISPECIES: response regulator transcription factor [Enterococcaceae]|uniref:response regulator transcription factor n=1 Tax=Enterococcaceae TaxID=81852 RepID=UPI000E4761BB|nr:MULTISPECIES: response regulator transcription factor [Enterococcaceae]RGI31138.1 DNA-binding response regulator [Melissococcus sp. OM08-11BH]UNM89101.1 response regulator transcription factor [Vagococcus sp. CY52-2]